MTQIISVSISDQFYELARKHNVSWSEAMRIGLSIVFAELGELPYDNKLNLYRKMNYFRKQAEESLQEVEELSKKLQEREGVKIEKGVAQETKGK